MLFIISYVIQLLVFIAIDKPDKEKAIKVISALGLSLLS